MKHNIFLLFVFLLAASATSSAQDTIRLQNPSFEDEPQHSLPPRGWEDRGFHGESPPDTQPSGDFGVTQKPFHGQSYLGMVVRDNDTWECVAQEIDQPLQKDSCYQLGLRASQSPYYVSISRVTGKEVNFNQPCRLRLWGARKKGGKGYELLAETPPVDHPDWQRYTLSFTPTMDITYIYLEAYYSSDGVGAYNGNVLVDKVEGIWACGE